LFIVAVVAAVVTAAGVVAVTAPILLLKVVQLADDNAPLLTADAVGKLNVCAAPEELIVKSVPVVLVAKVCTEAVNPLSDVKALPDNKLDKVLVVTLPVASVVTMLVLTMLVPMPCNLTDPVVCNCAVGADVPIPMLPEFLLYMSAPDIRHLLESTNIFVPFGLTTICAIPETVMPNNSSNV
jgi:hypothetical protein